MKPNKYSQPFDKTIKEFSGDISQLEAAIGALIVGQRLGWKVLLLIHNKRTIRKYEKILGLSFRDEMPEVGELAHKSRAWTAVQKLGNFWKAVSGDTPGIRTPELKRGS